MVEQGVYINGAQYLQTFNIIPILVGSEIC